MPATTARHKIPYPVGGDRVSTLDDTGKAAAERVDALFSMIITSPADKKVHQAIPANATPVLKALFHAGTTNQHGQIIVPVTGADLAGWHSAIAIPTNLSNVQHDARCTLTGTHAQGPVLTFTNGQGHRMGNTPIGVTVFVVGWRA